MESKKPLRLATRFHFICPHTVPIGIRSNNYSPSSRHFFAKLLRIRSRTAHSPSEASARPSPRVSIKSPEPNALHTWQILAMVNLIGDCSRTDALGYRVESACGSCVHNGRYKTLH